MASWGWACDWLYMRGMYPGYKPVYLYGHWRGQEDCVGALSHEVPKTGTSATRHIQHLWLGIDGGLL